MSFIIGICGGSASGKTTIANKLKLAFSEDLVIISQDNYYKSQDKFLSDERKKLNFDCPDAIETSLLVKHIVKLKRSESIEQPLYDFTNHVRLTKTMSIKPHKIILVEGLLIFENIELQKLFDMKIFIQADKDIRFIRRLQRDINERGRDINSVVQQYLDFTKPMYKRYIEPYSKDADYETVMYFIPYS